MSAPGDPQAPSPTAVLFYDGECQFCIAQAQRLFRVARQRFEIRSFHEEKALDDIPALTIEDCLREMKFVDPAGRISGGAEAAVRSLAFAYANLGRILYVYYVPGLRWIADRVYAWVARNRYRIAASRGGSCETGACPRHTP